MFGTIWSTLLVYLGVRQLCVRDKMFGSTWGQNNTNNNNNQQQQQTSAFGQPANTFGSGQFGSVLLSSWRI
jgi:hypothetical protein